MLSIAPQRSNVARCVPINKTPFPFLTASVRKLRPSISVISFELVGLENQACTVSTMPMPVEEKFRSTRFSISVGVSKGKQSCKLVLTI